MAPAGDSRGEMLVSWVAQGAPQLTKE